MSAQDEEIKSFLLKLGHAVEAEAKAIAPVREGRLKGDIQVFTTNLASFEVAVGNSKLIHYAPFVHNGTGIYGKYKSRIVPTKKQALKTPFGIFKSVAGQKANPYLYKALENITNSSKLDYLMQDMANKISDDIFKNIKENLKSFKIE